MRTALVLKCPNDDARLHQVFHGRAEALWLHKLPTMRPAAIGQLVAIDAVLVCSVQPASLVVQAVAGFEIYRAEDDAAATREG